MNYNFHAVGYQSAASGTKSDQMGGARSPNYYFKMEPGTYQASEPYQTHYRINSLGFRGAEFDPKHKSSGVVRIFCVGESSTFGMESEDGDTWPARLGHYLDERQAGHYEVINAGSARTTA